MFVRLHVVEEKVNECNHDLIDGKTVITQKLTKTFILFLLIFVDIYVIFKFNNILTYNILLLSAKMSK